MSAQIGESTGVVVEGGQDVCAECLHPISNHETAFRYVATPQSGNIHIGDARYCWICMKVCRYD